jgi:hypothetical protein
MPADNKELSELLSRLETKASEGLAQLTFEGHAIGKTNDSLHLATSSGVVAIPLSEIETVAPIFGVKGGDWVSVVVRNADRVTHIRRVRLIDSALLRIPWVPQVDTTMTTDFYDTTTITNLNGADATDDVVFYQNIDDQNV